MPWKYLPSVCSRGRAEAWRGPYKVSYAISDSYVIAKSQHMLFGLGRWGFWFTVLQVGLGGWGVFFFFFFWMIYARSAAFSGDRLGLGV